MSNRISTEVFSPGEILKEELEARKWSQQELSDILDRPPRVISEIIAGKRAITPETAIGLSRALGTSAQYWLALESQYQLSKIRVENDEIERKARLYERFPVREMIRRGWIRSRSNVAEMEQEFCRFFHMKDIDQELSFVDSDRVMHLHEELNAEDLAWLFRVRELAALDSIPFYSEKKLEAAISILKTFMLNPEDIGRVPDVLHQSGVRIVFVEPLSGSRIDGACFWMEKMPVIGMTLRTDRIDHFWLILWHEIEHVRRNDVKRQMVLDREIAEGKIVDSKQERVAGSSVDEFGMPKSAMENFIEEAAPFISEEKILEFSRILGIHPGLVVGGLQRRLDRHDFMRKHLIRIRGHLLESGTCDGWGIVPSDRHGHAVT